MGSGWHFDINSRNAKGVLIFFLIIVVGGVGYWIYTLAANAKPETYDVSISMTADGISTWSAQQAQTWGIACPVFEVEGDKGGWTPLTTVRGSMWNMNEFDVKKGSTVRFLLPADQPMYTFTVEKGLPGPGAATPITPIPADRYFIFTNVKGKFFINIIVHGVV